ncbi:MAG: hypothetical protein ACYC2U_04455 [Candidatus Amoebophilus sp.]
MTNHADIYSQQLFILTGTSGSGKSSISAELIKKFTNLVYIHGDALIREECLQIMNELQPHAFTDVYAALGENTAYYVFLHSKKDIFFIKNLAGNPALIQALEMLSRLFVDNKQYMAKWQNRIHVRLFKIIQDSLANGHAVLVDMVLDQVGLNRFKQFMPHVINVYVPLKQLLEYTWLRNKRAIKENTLVDFRQPSMVCSQLGMFVINKSKPNMSHIILEEIRQDEVKGILTRTIQDHQQLGVYIDTDVEKLFMQFSENLNLKYYNRFYARIHANIVLNSRNLAWNNLIEAIYRYMDEVINQRKLSVP